MKKILTVCEGGNVRSVAAAYILKDLGHIAVPVGWKHLDLETSGIMLSWAEDILPLCKSAYDWVPDPYRNKVTLLDVGDDRWGNPGHPDLVITAEDKIRDWLKLEPICRRKVQKMGIAHCVTSQGAVSMWWARMGMSVLWENNTPRLPFWIEDDVGDMVAEARNELVQRILQFETPDMGVSHLFWHDDDVVLVSALALKGLLSHDEDICAGVYFTKGVFGKPLIFPERLTGVKDFVPNSIGRYWGCGMGLTLIKTEVYKRMRDELYLGVDGKGNPKWYHTSRKDPPKLVDGCWDMGGTEDLHFCEQASKLGYRPVIDCGPHTFGFHYDLKGDFGKPKVAYPLDQWNEYRKTGQVTWRTKAGDVVWR